MHGYPFANLKGVQLTRLYYRLSTSPNELIQNKFPLRAQWDRQKLRFASRGPCGGTNSEALSPQEQARRFAARSVDRLRSVRESLLEQYRDPIPTNASKANVSAFAEDLATQLGFDPGDPIESVVSQLGGAIAYRNPVGSEKPESIRVEPSGAFKIFLPSVTSISRDRFTIAHELGHFFLHFPLVKEQNPHCGMKATRWVDENNQALQRCEWEANWFAASFVMPQKQFIAVYKAGGARMVSERFGVSEMAAGVRARSLGL
jgi:hypothetical protein